MIANNSTIEIREKLFIVGEIIWQIVRFEEVFYLFIDPSLPLKLSDFFDQVEGKRISCGNIVDRHLQRLFPKAHIFFALFIFEELNLIYHAL